MVKQKAVDRFSADPGQIFGTGPDEEIGGRNGGEAKGCAGPAKQTVKERGFDVIGPVQTSFDYGAEQCQATARHAGFVPGGAKDRAGHLTKPTFIALGNFVVIRGNSHRNPLYLSRQSAGGENTIWIEDAFHTVHDLPIGPFGAEGVMALLKLDRCFLQQHMSAISISQAAHL
jgi:hypothetical protein